MDEHLAFKKPYHWIGGDAAEKGATVGVGLLVSAILFYQGGEQGLRGVR